MQSQSAVAILAQDAGCRWDMDANAEPGSPTSGRSGKPRPGGSAAEKLEELKKERTRIVAEDDGPHAAWAEGFVFLSPS